MINNAQFLTSNTQVSECPSPVYPEFAFCGRSNVGKSSLINMIVGIKGLAKTSSTPGKTQCINHFIVNGKIYLADLPGYGYAKVSKSEKLKWPEMTRKYLLERKNLMCLFLLIDSRLTPQRADLDFIQFLGASEIPFVIVFTKADKMTPRALKVSTTNFLNTLLESWESLPKNFLTSSSKNRGKAELVDFIIKSAKGFKRDF